MKKTRTTIIGLVLLFVPTVGCFGPQDRVADTAFQRSIADQRTMAAQDEAAERGKLEAARKAGLAFIVSKRIETGKSLEGLNGPDGRPLLSWSTAETLNQAFSDLETKFNGACDALDKAIVLKYAQRDNATKIAEAYLSYNQTRRNSGEYVWQGFVEGMKDVEVSGQDVNKVFGDLGKLGLPTNVNDLSGWLQGQFGKTLNSVLPQLGGNGGEVLGKIQNLIGALKK